MRQQLRPIFIFYRYKSIDTLSCHSNQSTYAMALKTSRPTGNNHSPEIQHAQKVFFFNNLGQVAKNKYAQGQVTPE